MVQDPPGEGLKLCNGSMPARADSQESRASGLQPHGSNNASIGIIIDSI